MIKYFYECKKKNVTPLPILFKVYNQTLQLNGYTLNEGVVQSLAEALAVYPEIIHSIQLSQNGLKDSQIALIFRAMRKLAQVKAVVIKHNEFMNESLEALEELLQRSYPNELEELRLISCKTSFKVTSKLA